MQHQALKEKYQHYQRQRHFILCVTLSTYIKSSKYALSDRTRHMWEHHFIRRVDRRLPYKGKTKLDYDYVLEQSPEGYWHYHGLLAVPEELSKCLWKNGALHPQLAGSIRSFEKAGSQRPFCINSFLIEPVQTVEDWCNYITKRQSY